MAAMKATPPTAPPTIAPTFVEELRFEGEPEAAELGVMIAVDVLKMTITDPPGSVDDDAITDCDVEGGSREVLLSGKLELLAGVELILMLSAQLVPKSVAVGVVRVTGIVTTAGTSVDTTRSEVTIVYESDGGLSVSRIDTYLDLWCWLCL
jgi:hypothetical protein